MFKLFKKIFRFFFCKKKREKISSFKLERFHGNPIISPINGLYWESKATFNPTAFENDGTIHILYRAVGQGDVSTLGYVTSHDGLFLKDKSFNPVFIHQQPSSKNCSLPLFYSSGGGGNGGAEDPRITKLEDMLYMTYTAFDGWGSVRIGLTSIRLKDFLNRNWNWKSPKLISKPGEIHKNWAVFPEKINGKYAILHSITPEILVEYFDNLQTLDGKKYIESCYHNSSDWGPKNRKVRGIGPAPIKTEKGWLFLYHAMETNDPDRYKLFAMLTDLNDPTKIIAKSKKAVLEPEEHYENEGYKWGVVYSCGAVVKDNKLIVYYGGADMFSCVATTDLNKFLNDLQNVTLEKKKNVRR